MHACHETQKMFVGTFFKKVHVVTHKAFLKDLIVCPDEVFSCTWPKNVSSINYKRVIVTCINFQMGHKVVYII